MGYAIDDDRDWWLHSRQVEGEGAERGAGQVGGGRGGEVVESRAGSIPSHGSGDVLVQSQASLKINDQSQTSRPAVLPCLETLLTASIG